MRVDVYSRHDVYVGTIATGELLSFVHTDELNGEDSVSIQTTFPLREGYRLVWRDPQGTCHEHVCQDPKGTHEAGTVYSDTALNSVCELFGDFIEDKRPYGYSFLKALEVALEPTRWVAGTVDQSGTVGSGQTFYHISAREALNDILECGGELETTITVGTSGVSSRKVGIRQHRGSSAGHRRFVYGKDISSVAKTEHWGAITACYGYGKGVETDSGGYGRKLTFGDINGGLNYVADSTALKTYGRPDGNGGYAHVFGVYENSDCEDAEQLLSETTEYLEEHSVPGVTYTADVLDLVQFGRSWEGVAVGDDVQVVDKEFDPELRLEGRVTKLVRDCLGGSMEVTLGNVTETMADMWMAQQQAVSSLSKRSSNWDVAANTPAAYLQQLMDGLNEQFNTLGMSYRFDSFEKGTIYSSVPLDDEGNPTKTGGWAMQLCSQGFRIASGTKADGSWDWTTFGTGEGFTANAITTGVLMANLVTAGVLRVQKDGVTVFEADFDSGNVTISGAVGAANSTLGAMAVDCDVQYGLSTSSSVTPTSWSTNANWKQGYYLWTRTKMTLADGSTAYGDACLVSEGEGIGTASVTEQYALSASSTTAPTTFYDYQPPWKTGYHYWTRSKITWSDGTVTYTTAVLARALTSGNQSTDDLDDELDQTEVFNRLTNNGKTQGIYMSGGLLYINATYIKAGIITDGKGYSSWNLATGAFTTKNMKASNITASGTFTCGDTSSYGLKMTSSGTLAGYRSGEQNGYIACNSAMTWVPTGETMYGMQLWGKQHIRISTPILSTASTSSTSTTTTTGTTTSHDYVTSIVSNDNGSITWYTRTQKTINGLVTSF